MGQYYVPVIEAPDGRIMTLYSHEFDNGLKLTEHSWIGNNLVNAVISLIYKSPNIYAWYASEAEEKLWRPLLRHITLKKEQENVIMNTNNPFHGKTVVATGKMVNYTRDGIQLKLLSLGAKPGSSVSKNTDYLIVGENAGSKLDKAQSLGVKTLTEAEFEAMLAEPKPAAGLANSPEIAKAMILGMFTGGKRFGN